MMITIAKTKTPRVATRTTREITKRETTARTINLERNDH